VVKHRDERRTTFDGRKAKHALAAIMAGSRGGSFFASGHFRSFPAKSDSQSFSATEGRAKTRKITKRTHFQKNRFACEQRGFRTVGVKLHQKNEPNFLMKIARQAKYR
jgi:hypothetical protein